MSTSPTRHRAHSNAIFSLPIRNKYPLSDLASQGACPSDKTELLSANATPIPLVSPIVDPRLSRVEDAPAGAYPDPFITDNSDDEDEDEAGHFSVPATAPASVDLSSSPKQLPPLPDPPASSATFAGLAARRGLPLRSVQFEMATVSAVQNIQSTSAPLPIPTWLQSALAEVMQVLDSQQLYQKQMRVLSQALPVPSTPGHFAISIVQHVQLNSLPTRLTFINVLHAMPGRYQLSNAPRTPPATPAPSAGGQNYFSARVFDTAVEGVEYTPGKASTRVELRDHHLAAPESVELSILERYITPGSKQESNSLLNLYSHSPLADRLIELSPASGCLLFIYPTKQGSDTFQSKLLGPALTATLREMSMVHELTEDFANSIDVCETSDTLFDFKEMSTRVRMLLADMNAGIPAAQTRLHGRPAGYGLVYAQRQQVVIPSEVWTQWWTKQEKERIRSSVDAYFVRQAGLGGRDQDSEPEPKHGLVLVEEMFRRIRDRAKRLEEERTANPVPMEMGVFVIRRITVQ